VEDEWNMKRTRKVIRKPEKEDRKEKW